MDAYDIASKLQKYWAALYPKNSGDLVKPKVDIKVCVMTEDGLRVVKGVHIIGERLIQLELDKE